MRSKVHSPIHLDDLQKCRASCRDLTNVVARKERLDHTRQFGPLLREIMRYDTSQSTGELHRYGLSRCRDYELEDRFFERITFGLSDRKLIGPRTGIVDDIGLLDAIFYVERASLSRCTDMRNSERRIKRV